MASNDPCVIAINNSRVKINSEMDDVSYDSVLDHLMVDVLRQDQNDELAACVTPLDRYRRLADMLVLHRDVKGAFATFCSALREEGKAGLADQLLAEHCRQVVAREQRPAVDGGDVCGHVLSANRLAIDGTVHNIDTYLDHLLRDEAFNNDQCEQLQAFKSLSDRKRHLVNMVICLAGRPRVFESFCNALVEDHNASLADLLRTQCQQRGRQPAPARPPSPPPSLDNWLDDASIRLRHVTHKELQLLSRLPTVDSFAQLGNKLGFIDTQMKEFRDYAPHCLELQVLQMLFAWYNREKSRRKTIVGILVPLLREGGIDEDKMKEVFCRAVL